MSEQSVVNHRAAKTKQAHRRRSQNEEDGVIRVNISVPRKLKAEIDAVTEPTNWSAVACDAFRRKLLELQARKEAKSLEEVVVRLRAAGKLERDVIYQEAWEAGEVWAKTVASPGELQSLQQRSYIFRDMLCWHLEVQQGLHDQGVAVGMWQCIHPLQKLDIDSVHAFWKRALGEGGEKKIEDFNYSRGFVDGALSVWEMVADQL